MEENALRRVSVSVYMGGTDASRCVKCQRERAVYRLLLISDNAESLALASLAHAPKHESRNAEKGCLLDQPTAVGEKKSGTG